MPFKSRAQQRLFFAKEERGELPKGTALEWAHHTPDIKKLPEHVKKKKQEKEANMTPLVAAFVSRCEEKKMTGEQIDQAVKLACARFPVIADEFEKAGFVRGALRVGGGIAGGIAGAIGGGLAGGLVTTPTIAGIPVGVTAGGVAGGSLGGLAGEEAGRWIGNKFLGEEKPEQSEVKKAFSKFILPVGGAIAGAAVGDATGTGATRGALVGLGAGAGAAAGHHLGSDLARSRKFLNSTGLNKHKYQHTAKFIRGAGAVVGGALGAGAGNSVGREHAKESSLREKQAVLGLDTAARYGASLLGKGVSAIGRMLPKSLNAGRNTQTFSHSLGELGQSLQAPRATAQQAAQSTARQAASTASKVNTQTSQRLGEMGHKVNPTDAGRLLAAHGNDPGKVLESLNNSSSVRDVLHALPPPAAAPSRLQQFNDYGNAAMVPLMIGGMGSMFMPGGGGEAHGGSQTQSGLTPQASDRRGDSLVDNLMRKMGAEHCHPFGHQAKKPFYKN